jgi:mRNA-degrading endonuclease toxin of MazEF toxin-antitoxin module
MSKPPVNRGEVYLVKENAIQFPKERLPGTLPPHRHQQRPVVVLQCDEDNHDPTYPIVLIAPISSRADLKKQQDFLVHAGEAGLRTDSIIMLGLIQPVLRQDLEEDCLGRFRPARMTEITAMLLCNLGVFPRPAISRR